MQRWLHVSGRIDGFTRRVGRATVVLLAASIAVSAGNAIVRKLFSVSSNRWLELSWHLFGAAFLLGAAYVLLVDRHVRVDALAQRLSARTRAALDAAVLALALLPLCALSVVWGGRLFWQSFLEHEGSFNAGGLLRWPLKLCLPVGFALLGLQAVSELIKRVAFLRGRRDVAVTTEADLPPFVGSDDDHPEGV